VIVKGAMKPLPTLTKPLRSVDITTGEETAALKERTDSCTVPAAGVVAEAMAALVFAEAYLEKFGGDNISDTQAALSAYQDRIAGEVMFAAQESH
jgi:chorismate synthase